MASTDPAGKILELGTGLSSARMLDAMDEATDQAEVRIAQDVLGRDSRIEFHIQDGGEFLRYRQKERFDLIFADTWPG